jgi:hypothetical protein
MIYNKALKNKMSDGDLNQASVYSNGVINIAAIVHHGPKFYQFIMISAVAFLK